MPVPDYFDVGAIVANVKILRQVVRGATQEKTRYCVLFQCCGAEVEVTHKWIVKRIKDQNKLCRTCNYKAAIRRRRKAPDEQPMVRNYHGWTPPPTAVALKRTLCR